MNTHQLLLIPIGAVTAAIIAGLFSYLALIVSKEQKTSEFRQAWVDALREEMANFVASVRLMRYTVSNLKKQHGGGIPPDKQHEAISEPYEKAIVAYNSILLRLNPKNPSSAALITLLKEVRDFIREGELEKATDRLAATRDQARVVLKEEWERVKRGEPVFVWSKRILGILIASGIIGLASVVYSAFGRNPVDSPPQEQRANKTPDPTPTSATLPAGT